MGAERIDESGDSDIDIDIDIDSPSCLSDKNADARAKRELRIQGLRQRLRYFQVSVNEQPSFGCRNALA